MILFRGRLIRPSTDDFFIWELFPKIFPNSKEIKLLIKSQPTKEEYRQGCVDWIVEELITYQEILDRKNELRPDLRMQLPELVYHVESGMIAPDTICDPFSLTTTDVITFDSWENAKLAYDNTFNYENIIEFKEINSICNNTIDHEFFIDGIKFDNWDNWVSKI